MLAIYHGLWWCPGNFPVEQLVERKCNGQKFRTWPRARALDTLVIPRASPQPKSATGGWSANGQPSNLGGTAATWSTLEGSWDAMDWETTAEFTRSFSWWIITWWNEFLMIHLMIHFWIFWWSIFAGNQSPRTIRRRMVATRRSNRLGWSVDCWLTQVYEGITSNTLKGDLTAG